MDRRRQKELITTHRVRYSQRALDSFVGWTHQEIVEELGAPTKEVSDGVCQRVQADNTDSISVTSVGGTIVIDSAEVLLLLPRLILSLL